MDLYRAYLSVGQVLPYELGKRQGVERHACMETFNAVKIEMYSPEPYIERLRDALHLAHAGRVA